MSDPEAPLTISHSGDSGLTDSHCHLSDERVFAEADALIARAMNAGVTRIALAGVEPAEWTRQLELKARYSDLLTLNFGLHPWWVEKYSRAELDSILHELDTRVAHAQGVGETGLDFHSKRNASRFDDQREAFRQQIRIAKKHSKPLVLHVVQAHEECVKILKEECSSAKSMGASDLGIPILVHSYSGNVTQLQEYLRLGAFISYSGTLVRAAQGDGHEKTAKALLNTPIQRLLFETDAPDQGWGDPENSDENEPARVREVYEAALKIMELPLQSGLPALAEVVGKNFRRLFGALGNVPNDHGSAR